MDEYDSIADSGPIMLMSYLGKAHWVVSGCGKSAKTVHTTLLFKVDIVCYAVVAGNPNL